MGLLYEYGYDCVKSVIFQCCPLQGTAVAGDLFCGRLDAQEVTLEAASWSGSAPYTYELTLSGVSSHDNYEIIGFTPTEDDDDNEE